MSLVVDANALLDLVPGRPRRGTAMRLFRLVVPKRGAVAPILLAWEIGNALLTDGFLRSPGAVPAEDFLEDLVQRVGLEAPDEAARRRTMQIATQTGLSYYDASYLATTERHPDRMLVTEDQRLLAAARRLLGPSRAATAAEALGFFHAES